jgi:DNA-binding NarL/FixJ family response regulator
MTGSQRTTRLLIVDDHPTFRAGVAALVEHIDAVEICAEAENTPEAMEKLASCAPDMMIADINLRKGSGLTLIERARKEAPALKILVVSMYEENVYGKRAILAGADGYYCKQDTAEALIAAISAVSAGDLYISTALGKSLLSRHSQGKDAQSHPEAALSVRELEIFTLFGEGYSTKEIASRLSLSPKTVDTHRDHLKKKIGIPNNNRLLRRAVEWVIANGA